MGHKPASLKINQLLLHIYNYFSSRTLVATGSFQFLLLCDIHENYINVDLVIVAQLRLQQKEMGSVHE